jgi:hypothetical protein
MITIEQSDNLINVSVLGEFTLADFKQFEELALLELKSTGEINLLFDLRDMISYTVDVAWEEIKFFSREHQHDCRHGCRAYSWMLISAHLPTTMKRGPGLIKHSLLNPGSPANFRHHGHHRADTGSDPGVVLSHAVPENQVKFQPYYKVALFPSLWWNDW